MHTYIFDIDKKFISMIYISKLLDLLGKRKDTILCKLSYFIFKTGFTHFIALFIFGFLEQICVHVA